MPEVVRIRSAREEDAAAITHVHVAAWQTAYRGIVPDAYLDALDPATRVELWREALRDTRHGRFTLVAEATDDLPERPGGIVGFAAGGDERDGIKVDGLAYDAEIYALYLLAEHRRHGIGRRLVGAATERLLARGARAMVIWALRDNPPARAFYERLGGVVIGEKTVTIGSSNLVDVAYGWPDARALLAAARGTSG